MPASPPPHLRKTARSSQLIVNGKPFLLLAAELHNGSFSDAAYMSTVWPDMKQRHINTLLGAVQWDLIEPVEGRFDFSEIDKIILDARQHGFHLGLLWFGTYKNALSSYAPEWVRQDHERFPRIRIKQPDGSIQVIESIQPYCEDVRNADARAFAALMKHLAEFDQENQTVILVQIENEMGVMLDSRDRSPEAEALIKGPVPEGLLNYLRGNWDDLHPTFRDKFPKVQHAADGVQTWAEAFGGDQWTDDMFMADAFSRFAQHVAAAGRAEHNIPLYLNVALCSEDSSWQDFDQVPDGVPEGEIPGQFPSGGPVGHNLDVYLYNAPDIEFYAPDIYLQKHGKAAACFAWRNMPLFIPEQRRDAYGVRRIWAALANNLAISCSPFGIDSLEIEKCPLPLHYGLLSKLSGFILEAQAERASDIFGFFFDESKVFSDDSRWVREMGGFTVTVQRASVTGKPSPAAGMIIRQPDGSYLLAGFGYQVTWKSTSPRSIHTAILKAEEGDIDENGDFVRGRALNGDETAHGKLITMPAEDPDYGGFPIPFLIPARTMIAKCTPYSLED